MCRVLCAVWSVYVIGLPAGVACMVEGAGLALLQSWTHVCAATSAAAAALQELRCLHQQLWKLCECHVRVMQLPNCGCMQPESFLGS
jgi:hypothetical protein